MTVIKDYCLIEARKKHMTIGGALELSNTLDLNDILVGLNLDTDSLSDPNIVPLLLEKSGKQRLRSKNNSMGCLSSSVFNSGPSLFCCKGPE